MQLDYLLFDATDEEDGACSFDALASVLPSRLPAVLDEIRAVLRWAHDHFGAPSGAEDGDWDFELQAVDEQHGPLEIRYDVARDEVFMPPARGRVAISLTLSGSSALAAAFRDAFAERD